MDRRSFAKALASVAGALKITSGISGQVVPTTIDSSVLLKSKMSIPSDWEEAAMSHPPEDYPSPPSHSLSNLWARKPSDPPLTLQQQLMLRDSGRSKSFNNSDRFFSSSPHPVAKAKNLYVGRIVHNHYPKYSTRRYFRDYGSGNLVENWIKARRNSRISTELKELKEELKGLQGD